MEGTLNKWTNVIKGWQLRWFVLDDRTGELNYYTSRENMTKDERRGCIRLGVSSGLGVARLAFALL